ncbi:MAG TPA: glycosyltransferase family 4 protein [Thermomicrobiaceae bacterium]|nr:glycosyltransferase family 4 protein [Thermomicrobiaceae bacterium]
MRVAIIAPLVESVPPALYGGTERVVSVLTEELVRRGHGVTLFASGDSVTSARLVPCAPVALRLAPGVTDYATSTRVELRDVYGRAGEFDLIHNHVDHLAFPFARLTGAPTITTTHGRLDLAEVHRLYRAYPEAPLVSISDNQRTHLPGANWLATVPNGIDLANFQVRSDPGDYLVFLGRISPEKRPDRAIAIARAVGMRLVIAAKIDDVDRAYYEHAIAPLMRDQHTVEFIGEVDERDKDELLGGAYAYLFPIDWPEPFGLTMVEAMATGTPVIASRAGSVPEVVVDGVTGFICDSVPAMVDAIARVPQLDRLACRRHVEQHFSAAAMVDGYERVYARSVAGGPLPVEHDTLVAVS